MGMAVPYAVDIRFVELDGDIPPDGGIVKAILEDGPTTIPPGDGHSGRFTYGGQESDEIINATASLSLYSSLDLGNGSRWEFSWPGLTTPYKVHTPREDTSLYVLVTTPVAPPHAGLPDATGRAAGLTPVWTGTSYVLRNLPHVGSTAPASPWTGDTWIDTADAANPTLRYWDGTVWITVGSAGGGGGLTQAQVDARINALVAIKMTQAERDKLAAVEARATADQTPAEIVTGLSGLSGPARLPYSAVRDGPPADATDDQTPAELVTALSGLQGAARLPYSAIDGTPAAGSDRGELEALPALPATTGRGAGDVANDRGSLYVLDRESDNKITGTAAITGTNRVGANGFDWSTDDMASEGLYFAQLPRSAFTGPPQATIYGRFRSLGPAGPGFSNFLIFSRLTSEDNATEYGWRNDATLGTSAIEEHIGAGTRFEVDFFTDANFSVPLDLTDTERWLLLLDRDSIHPAPVQSDWDETDTGNQAFILNKPDPITTAERNKLAAIESGATADQTPAEIVTGLSGLSGPARLPYSAVRDGPPADATDDQTPAELVTALSGLSGAARLPYSAIRDGPAARGDYELNATPSLANGAYRWQTSQQLALAAGTITAGSGLSIVSNEIRVAAGTATRLFVLGITVQIESTAWRHSAAAGSNRLFFSFYLTRNGTEIPGTRRKGYYRYDSDWAPVIQPYGASWQGLLRASDRIAVQMSRLCNYDHGQNGNDVNRYQLNAAGASLLLEAIDV